MRKRITGPHSEKAEIIVFTIFIFLVRLYINTSEIKIILLTLNYSTLENNFVQ